MTDIAVCPYSASDMALLYVTEKVRNNKQYKLVPVQMVAQYMLVVRYLETRTGRQFEHFSECFSDIDEYLGKAK